MNSQEDQELALALKLSMEEYRACQEFKDITSKVNNDNLEFALRLSMEEQRAGQEFENTNASAATMADQSQNKDSELNVSVKPIDGSTKEIDAKFKCSKCNETFNCENSLNTHNKIICPPTNLSKDGNNKLYIFQFKCSICVQKFLTREHIIGHLEGFHKKFTKYEKYMIKDDKKENIRFDHNLLFENGQYKEMKEKKSFLIENFGTKLSENIKEEKDLENFILDFDQKEKVKNMP